MPVFEKGNKAAEKWTEEDAVKAFEDMLDFTMNNDQVLSVQQAYIDYGMHPATYYYLTDKFPVLESVKNGINDILISRVNSGCLKGDLVATPGIWRMKQLGERDEKAIDHKSSDGSMTPKADLSKASTETLKQLQKEIDADQS